MHPKAPLRYEEWGLAMAWNCMSFRAFPALYLTLAIRQIQILLLEQILLLLVPDWAWPLSGFLWQRCGKS